MQFLSKAKPINRTFLVQLSLLALPVAAFGAHYGGQKVDGPRYGAFARSLDTGRYYAGKVVFDRDRANVQLDSGKTIILTLEEENIQDPEEVIATAQDGSFWALAIDGLDEVDGLANAGGDSDVVRASTWLRSNGDGKGPDGVYRRIG